MIKLEFRVTLHKDYEEEEFRNLGAIQTQVTGIDLEDNSVVFQDTDGEMISMLINFTKKVEQKINGKWEKVKF